MAPGQQVRPVDFGGNILRGLAPSFFRARLVLLRPVVSGGT